MTVEELIKQSERQLTKQFALADEISEYNQEKVLKTAKKKGEELKDKTEDLVNLAKDKGNTVLEGIAKDLKTKAVEVAKEVVNKLEEK